MPTGKPRDAPSPQTITPTTDEHRVAAVHDEQQADDRRAAVVQQHRHPAEPVEQDGPVSRPVVMAVTNSGEAGDPDPVRRAVAVDQGEGEPVVGRTLGEREGEHHQPDRQRPRLPPRGDAGGSSVFRVRREEAGRGPPRGRGESRPTAPRCATSGTSRALTGTPMAAPRMLPRSSRRGTAA